MHDTGGWQRKYLELVANLCCAGLVTRRVTFEVSTHVSSSAKLAWRNDHQTSTPQNGESAVAALLGTATAEVVSARFFGEGA